MQYIVEGQEFEVVIEKKNNKNTYVRIKDDLKIYVTTSKYTTKSEIKRILDNNYSFLLKMIERKTLSNQRKKMFFYLGNTYDIIEVSIMDDIEIENGRIYTKNKTMLDKWYKRQIENIFKRKNYIYTISYLPTKTKRYKILRSPHVYKKSIETYEEKIKGE